MWPAMDGLASGHARVLTINHNKQLGNHGNHGNQHVMSCHVESHVKHSAWKLSAAFQH